MFNRLVKWSLDQRIVVLLLSVVLLVAGGVTAARMPVDVFPQFAPPQVVIQTEAPGLAPEEVETLVTLPIESALNGTPGVKTVRSSSAIGLSVVTAVFKLGSDIYRDRQLVAERLTTVASKLPKGTGAPTMSPITSPIGDILKIGLVSRSGKTSPMELRTLADWTLRNRLLAVPGVSRILVIGGDVEQFQVLVDPGELANYGVTLDQVRRAVEEANQNAPGGFYETPDQEYLVRGLGRVSSLADLADAVVTTRKGGTPVLVKDVAQVVIGPAPKRGDASVDGKPAVVMTISKQPSANTLATTHAVEAALSELKAAMPPDVRFVTVFRQADLIERSMTNVLASMRDGAILVVVILLVFLMNWRTALISTLAIPLSLLVAIFGMQIGHVSLNSMTLGGLTIAIGIVVDDAIVYVENVYRRLRENAAQDWPKSAWQTIFDASVEIRGAIVYATWILLLVFIPLFALSGVAGRIFEPLGVAYMISIGASLLVATTATPALCMLLLPNSHLVHHDTRVLTVLKTWYGRVLDVVVFKHPRAVIAASVAAFACAAALVPTFGQSFLPEFQEGNLIVALNGMPGTNLAATSRIGPVVERELRAIPGVEHVDQRAGRSKGDDDAGGVNYSELDIGVKEGAGKAKMLAHIRKILSQIPGESVDLGGFISHNMDEVLSGTRAAVAIKIFGPDLKELRQLGAEVQNVMSGVKGVVDLQTEPQIDVGQLDIRFDRQAAARYGLQIADLARDVQTVFNGQAISQVIQSGKLFDIYLWSDPATRNDPAAMERTLIDTPTGARIPLSEVAQVEFTKGPTTINREDVSRRIVVQCNVAGRDVGSLVAEARAKIARDVKLPPGYYVTYGGQFQSEQQASRQMTAFGILAVIAIWALLYLAFKSARSATLVLANLPLALIGGIVAVALTGRLMTIASIIGFITLLGISTRNGVLLVTHYLDLAKEGRPFAEIVRQGALDRLSPVLMTALAAALGMLPLAVFGGTGRELEQPLAIVIVGGMITSTALTLVVIPALYLLWGRKAIEIAAKGAHEAPPISHLAVQGAENV